MEAVTERQLDYVHILYAQGWGQQIEQFLQRVEKGSIDNLNKREATWLIHMLVEVKSDDRLDFSRMMDSLEREYRGINVNRIPSQHHLPAPLRNEEFRFCLVRPREKRAFEKGWQDTANYGFDNPVLLDHISEGGNHGVVGGFGGLVVVDIDHPGYISVSQGALPPTFTVRTKKGIHLYYVLLYGHLPSRGLTIRDTGEPVGDIKAGHPDEPRSRGYVVGPGSIHPEGTLYEVEEDRPLASISAGELEERLDRMGVAIGARYRRKTPPPWRVRDAGTVPYHGPGSIPDHGGDTVSDRAGGAPSEHYRGPRWQYAGDAMDDRVSEGTDTPGESKDPDYLSLLPLWYRTHHRKRNGALLRKAEGIIIHLRICATLKFLEGEPWREHAHHLTRWMFGEEYRFEKTEYHLDRIKEKYHFQPRDYFSFGTVYPDPEFLTGEELATIERILEPHFHEIFAGVDHQ